MQYFTEFDSLFEAFVYLNDRFTEHRLSARVPKLKLKSEMMNDDDRACLAQLIALEEELDREFMPDELMEHYFRPLAKKDEKAVGAPISIGYSLMLVPQPYTEPLSMERIVDFYRNAELSDVLKHFYQRISTSFFPEPPEGITDLNGFMEFIDDLLADTQAKWDLMDAVTNPVKHLELIRPLVEGVAASVKRHSVELRRMIETARARFLSKGTELEALGSIGFNVGEEELPGVAVFPGLFDFNAVTCIREAGEPATTRIQLGVFVCRIVELHEKEDSAKAFIDMLKLISDETRFKALHYMRKKYAFGQELADKLKCTRNTMYYHLDKLHGSGLIDIKVTDYRAFYRMNKKTVYEKLTALRDYLTDGWQPGDEEFPEDDADRKQDG